MESEARTGAGGAPADHAAHEQQLAAALADLLHQADVGDYRDARGQPLSGNQAFQKAQTLVHEFGVTHEVLCRTLEECGSADDLAAAARKILEARQAKPTDTPPEYQTWQTGP